MGRKRIIKHIIEVRLVVACKVINEQHIIGTYQIENQDEKEDKPDIELIKEKMRNILEYKSKINSDTMIRTLDFKWRIDKQALGTIREIAYMIVSRMKNITNKEDKEICNQAIDKLKEWINENDTKKTIDYYVENNINVNLNVSDLLKEPVHENILQRIMNKIEQVISRGDYTEENGIVKYKNEYDEMGFRIEQKEAVYMGVKIALKFDFGNVSKTWLIESRLDRSELIKNIVQEISSWNFSRRFIDELLYDLINKPRLFDRNVELLQIVYQISYGQQMQDNIRKLVAIFLEHKPDLYNEVIKRIPQLALNYTTQNEQTNQYTAGESQ